MGSTKAVLKLRQWCVEHHLPWNDDSEWRFERYIELLLHYQKHTNLIGFKNAEDIVESLFVDSVQILRTGPMDGPLMDVGTGAGFPSVPIKILCPGLELHLVEPRSRRYAFLQILCRELGLENVHIHASKIESVSVPPIGFAISKAFAPVLEWVGMARPWALNGAEIGCLVSEKDWNAALPEISRIFSIGRVLTENSRVYARLSSESGDVP